MSVATERRLSIEGADQQLLAGVNDSNLTTLARLCDIRVVLRRDEMILSGPQADVDRASPTARRMIRYARLRRPFDAVDVERFLEAPADGDDGSRKSAGAGNSGGSGQSEVALAGAGGPSGPSPRDRTSTWPRFASGTSSSASARPAPERPISPSPRRSRPSTGSGSGA